MFVMRSKVGHFRGVDGLFGLLPQISIMVAAAITRMGSFASIDDQYTRPSLILVDGASFFFTRYTWSQMQQVEPAHGEYSETRKNVHQLLFCR